MNKRQRKELTALRDGAVLGLAGTVPIAMITDEPFVAIIGAIDGAALEYLHEKKQEEIMEKKRHKFSSKKVKRKMIDA